MESFSQSLFGYTSLFETCQNLALKFKYALSGDNLVKILHSTVIAKYPLNQDLINLLASVNRNELDSPVIQHQYDFITASLKFETISKEDKGYVDHRNELNTRVMPFIPNTKSYKVLLKEGETYYWCTCGLSKNQPFCDGAHKDLPPYKPLKFTYTEEDKIRGLCGCKMN
jgi:CDGSH iron-sulfur domain-containing protein 3